VKPKRGFAREIYEIVQADGPLAYNGIHERLRKRKVRMSKNQVKRCLINMQQRRQLVKSGQHYNKFVVVPFENGLVDEDVYSVTEMVDEWNEGGREAYAKAKTSNPAPNPSVAEKTPESDQITPTNGLIDDRTLGELKQSILVKAITLAGMLSVIAIVSSVTAVLTINFLGFA
jgi:hypothetical protein